MTKEISPQTQIIIFIEKKNTSNHCTIDEMHLMTVNELSYYY